MVIAYSKYIEINKLPSTQDKHRAWLKLREGLKYGRGVEGHYKKDEKWTESSYRDRGFSNDINLVGRLPNECRIEFDGDEKEAKKFLEMTIPKIKEKGWGYIRSTHYGKSDYLWIEFNRPMKDKELKAFLQWIAPEGSIIDENFASSEKIFPCLFAVHWKHSYHREMPIEFVEGNQIDFDSLGIKVNKTSGTSWKNYKDGFEYETYEKKDNFGEAIKIFNQKMEMAKEFYNRQPIYLDDGGLFWLWNKTKKCWEMISEIDLANKINDHIGCDTINSKERTEIIQALKQIGRKYKPVDLPRTWIQFKNGVIDINDGCVIKEVTHEYFAVNPIPWDIGVNDSTPVMDKIFEEWVGKDHVKTLYQILAYCLLPDYPLHRIFCFIGAGMNGKSKFLELLRKFIGEDNVTATELDTLITSRFEVTRLYKKLVCQMGETNFSELNKTSVLKKLSGGDMIGFEYKNKTPFESMNYAKILISTNNLPTTSDKTIGFYRRWLIIDFPNQFNEKKEILSDIPESEYENLAFKCIGILRELLEVKEFHNEGSIEDRMKKYEDHSDPLEKFIKEFTIDSPDSHIWKFEFEKKLNDWCKENRHRQISEVVIGKKMREKGIQQQLKQSEWFIDGHRKLLRAWVGLSWDDKVRVNKNNLQDKQDKQVTSSQFPCVGSELKQPVNPVNLVKTNYEIIKINTNFSEKYA